VLTEALLEGPVSTVNSDLTPMRIHEVALMHWCHRNFLVQDGYPVPVVFSKPMDAYGSFQTLWKADNNPFAYLLEARDTQGRPLYEPFPEPCRLPLISINRRRQTFRTTGNFSIHRQRKVSWPTVIDPDTKTIYREDLGNVRVRNRPMGISFHLDVSFWCLRPDTQAVFIQRVWNCFWRSGGKPQLWMPVAYPTDGKLQVHVELEGDINDSTTDDPGQEQVKYQTSFSVRIDGWQVDMRDTVLPALWIEIIRGNIVFPELIERVFQIENDMRPDETNPDLDTRAGIPPHRPKTPPI